MYRSVDVGGGVAVAVERRIRCRRGKRNCGLRRTNTKCTLWVI